MQPDRVLVGRILKAHGIGGEVVVAAMGGDPARFRPGAVLWLDPLRTASLAVAAAHEQSGGWRIRFEGISDRTAAEALVGRELFLPAEELPCLPEGEFYQFELEGLAVTRADRTELGRVVRVLDLPGNDLLEVRGPAGTWLVPSRKEFVEWVDLERGELRLTDRADLLEAQRPTEGEHAPARDGHRRSRRRRP